MTPNHSGIAGPGAAWPGPARRAGGIGLPGGRASPWPVIAGSATVGDDGRGRSGGRRMRRPRFTIWAMLAATAAVAAAVATLRHPTPLGASVIFTLAVGLVLAAIPLATYRRGQVRAFW